MTRVERGNERERTESAKCGLVLYFDLDLRLCVHVHMRYVFAGLDQGTAALLCCNERKESGLL